MKEPYRKHKSGKKPPAGTASVAGRKKAAKRRLSPGSDSKLKKVFSIIGVPETVDFIPDPFQLEAIAAVEQTDCIVTAPTGAGKTWIAEQVITRLLAADKKIWYASPLKALSNAIFEFFSSRFGPDKTGILTGDRKENSNAPIIVGTTEILRNQLYDSMHTGEDLDTDMVILDEAHFLGDVERGVVWEETMIYLPRRVPLLLLSATIGNPDEIASWLSSIRGKPCRVVRETTRPVRLYPLFLHPSGTLFPLMTEVEKSGRSQLYKKTVRSLQSEKSSRRTPPYQLPPMCEVIGVLRKYHLLPAIFFMKSRADCDKALDSCDQKSLDETPDRKLLLEQTISGIIARNPYLAGHKQLNCIREKAVAAHHSGHLPIWKKTVEQFMNSGLLDVVFATSTVAAGVNFPARSVVIFNSDRFNGQDFMPLTAIEFHQMTGRAGRRGKDNIGFALMVPGKFMDLRHIARLINSPPSSINSQIRINFSMTLNLLLALSPDQIKNLLKQSFARFQHSHSDAVEKTDHDLWQDFLDHVDFLKETGYADESGQLTDDGRWASQLRVDHPLMIAEGFRLGLFPADNPALLAAIIASFVNERQTDDPARPPEGVPKKLRTAFFRVRNRLTPFIKHMTGRGFMLSDLHLAPAVTIYRWASGSAWEAVVKEAGIEEGDLANLVFRTADNLRHIATLRHVFPEEAETASRAVEMIMMEPLA